MMVLQAGAGTPTANLPLLYLTLNFLDKTLNWIWFLKYLMVDLKNYNIALCTIINWKQNKGGGVRSPTGKYDVLKPRPETILTAVQLLK